MDRRPINQSLQTFICEPVSKQFIVSEKGFGQELRVILMGKDENRDFDRMKEEVGRTCFP